MSWFKFGNLDAIINRVEEVAKKRNVSMAQISLAWLFSKQGVTAPIVGVTKIENLKDLLGMLSVQSLLQYIHDSMFQGLLTLSLRQRRSNIWRSLTTRSLFLVIPERNL